MTKNTGSHAASSSSQDENAGQDPQSQDAPVILTIQDTHGVFGNTAAAQLLVDTVDTLQTLPPGFEMPPGAQNQGVTLGSLRQTVPNTKGLPEQISDSHRERIKQYRSSEDPHLKPLQEVEDRSQIEPDSIEENESTAT